jgi:hypothetical protein
LLKSLLIVKDPGDTLLKSLLIVKDPGDTLLKSLLIVKDPGDTLRREVQVSVSCTTPGRALAVELRGRLDGGEHPNPNPMAYVTVLPERGVLHQLGVAEGGAAMLPLDSVPTEVRLVRLPCESDVKWGSCQGCWEACCGTGYALPVQVSEMGPKSPDLLRLVPASASPDRSKPAAQLLPIRH